MGIAALSALGTPQRSDAVGFGFPLRWNDAGHGTRLPIGPHALRLCAELDCWASVGPESLFFFSSAGRSVGGELVMSWTSHLLPLTKNSWDLIKKKEVMGQR